MLRAPAKPFQRRASRIVTPPASEPVTKDELRAHTVTDSDSLPDDQADAYIEEARQWIEDAYGIAMITQTWRVALDRWPSGQEPWWDGVREGAISELSGPNRVYELPRYPLIAVDDVTAYDQAGTDTAVTISTTFDVDTYSIPGRLALKDGATWPVALRSTNAIDIVYQAGYGAKDDVPAPLRRSVLLLAGYLFDHRGACDLGNALKASGAASLAGQYAVARL
ncbi:MAG: hypothetical protein ABNH26_08755 [Celeribacter sp.]|jgi:hypothetical protein